MSKDKIVKRGSLRMLKEPKFLSLVDTPANRTGFKVIRDDNKMASNLKFTKREDAPLLSIMLPSEASESDAYDLMEVFGLGEEYEVAQREEGGYMLRRKTNFDGVSATEFGLGDGLTAQVDSASLAARGDHKGKGGVVVTSLEFQSEYFSELNDVQGWLRGKDVDFKEGGVEVVDGGFIVTRHDVPQGVETKKVAIQDGVTAIIAQAERADIPVGIVSPVSEYSYGNYGWGQLDFAAAMADPEFTSASWNALSTLGQVLEDIIFYSYLNVEERRVLIQRALGQFGDFVNGLLDALPKEVLIQIRSDKRNRKEFAMIAVDDKNSGMPAGKKPTEATAEEAARADEQQSEQTAASDAGNEATGSEEEAQRTDAQAGTETTDENASGATASDEDAARTDDKGAAATAAEEESASTATGEFVTRSELEEVVKGAVGETTAALGSLQEMMSKLVETVGEVKRSSEESNKALQEKLEAMESETVVRSDDDDEQAARSDSKSVFKGAIFGNRG